MHTIIWCFVNLDVVWNRFAQPLVCAFHTTTVTSKHGKRLDQKKDLINHSRARGIDILRTPKLNKVNRELD